MICGVTTYDAELGQYKTCTVPNVHPNHDMPGPDNMVNNPHKSGSYIWYTTYPLIGPEKLYVENTCWNCDAPFPTFQHGNVIPFHATGEELESGHVYRCPGCQMHFATIQFRREGDNEEQSREETR